MTATRKTIVIIIGAGWLYFYDEEDGSLEVGLDME